MKRLHLSHIFLTTIFSTSIYHSPLFAQTSSVQTDECYDASHSSDIRLWDNGAPGAVGTNPCTDIAFLRIYKPNGEAAVTSVGVIVMPGGGYNELIDKDEQAPVAKHFANKFGITTFVLCYRLVQANGTYRYPIPMWECSMGRPPGTHECRAIRHRSEQDWRIWIFSGRPSGVHHRYSL